MTTSPLEIAATPPLTTRRFWMTDEIVRMCVVAFGTLAGSLGLAAFSPVNAWRLGFMIALYLLTANATFYLQLKLSPAIAWVDARLTARWEGTVAVLATLLALGSLRLAYSQSSPRSIIAG